MDYKKKEELFNKKIITEYFKYGSVEKAFDKNRYSLPLSYASFQRVLDKWGVVKAAGPNSKLNETVNFLSHLVHDGVSLETLYKKMPPSFQTSAVTLYRILGYIKEGLTRRVGTALIISPYDNPQKVLLAKDVSLARVELGKPFASISLPMGYSRKRDSRKINIVRILQQEVFTNKVINCCFPQELIPTNPEPFMYLDIADVRVAVYKIQLTKELSSLKNFSSFKLKNYRFWAIDEVLANEKIVFRAGVVDATTGYKRYLQLLDRNLVVNPLQRQSLLNRELATVQVEIE